MIKVKVFKKPEEMSFDITTDLLKSNIDNITDALKKNFEESLNKIKCKNHSSNSKGTVLVNLDKPNNEFSFEDFCCKDYEDEIRNEMTKK